MSANNYIHIFKKEKEWYFAERDVETQGVIFEVHIGSPTLEDAIERANVYMADNEVEYGLAITT